MNSHIIKIEKELFELKTKLENHSLYQKLNSLEDIQTFMELHVFAVWDFMSLLKSLQLNLTSMSIPWVPAKNPNLVRFINEITLCEESDYDANGKVKSHFEMYLDAMYTAKANTENINTFIKNLQTTRCVEKALKTINIPLGVKEFVAFTFQTINSNKNHLIAAVFTFGRENVIPDMFLNIINKASLEDSNLYRNFVYYLNRHIELDGDEHGPLSLKMITHLCGDDLQKWEEVLTISKKAMQLRYNLWSSIEHQLKIKVY